MNLRSRQLGGIASLSALALVACTAIGTQKVMGWPEMEPVIHEVSGATLHKICGPTVRWYEMALGCAYFDFDKRVCNIYVSYNPQQFVLDHEKQHCKGIEHDGGHELAEIWKKYGK